MKYDAEKGGLPGPAVRVDLDLEGRPLALVLSRRLAWIVASSAVACVVAAASAATGLVSDSYGRVHELEQRLGTLERTVAAEHDSRAAERSDLVRRLERIEERIDRQLARP